MKGFYGTKELTRLHLKEMFLSPAFFIVAAISTVFGYLPVRGFVNSIGSQGFKPSLSPMFANITSSLESLFSEVLVEKLFAEGPFLFAFYCAFIPMLLYVCTSSIITYHFQHDVGAIELVRFGPIRSRTYLVSLFLKDMVLILIYILYLTATFFVISRLNNLLMGPAFIQAVFVLAFVSILVCVYARLAASVTTTGIGSLSLFLIVMVLFAIVHIGSYTVINDYIRNVSTVLSWIIQWFSPFYFITLIQTGLELGAPVTVIGGLIGTLMVGTLVGFVTIWVELHKETRT